MRLGIGSYTFTWGIGVPGYSPILPMDSFGLLDAAEKLGVHVVQICDNLPLHSLTPHELDRFIHAAHEREIAVEIGMRGILPDKIMSHLMLVRRLNGSFLRLVIDMEGDHPSPDETILRLKPLMREFDNAGVVLAIENHDRFASDDLAHIIEELGPNCAGVCLDTVNSFGALEGPDKVVGRLVPYCVNLHVKDFTIKRMGHNMGFIVEGCPAGSGRLNIPWLLSEITKSGKDPNAIVELWTPYTQSLEETIALEKRWAEESVKYLRGYIAE